MDIQCCFQTNGVPAVALVQTEGHRICRLLCLQNQHSTVVTVDIEQQTAHVQQQKELSGCLCAKETAHIHFSYLQGSLLRMVNFPLRAMLMQTTRYVTPWSAKRRSGSMSNYTYTGFCTTTLQLGHAYSSFHCQHTWYRAVSRMLPWSPNS